MKRAILNLVALSLALLSLNGCMKLFVKVSLEGGGGDSVITMGGQKRLYLALDKRWFRGIRAEVYSTASPTQGLYVAYAQADGTIVEHSFVNLADIAFFNFGNLFVTALVPTSLLTFVLDLFDSTVRYPIGFCKSIF